MKISELKQASGEWVLASKLPPTFTAKILDVRHEKVERMRGTQERIRFLLSIVAPKGIKDARTVIVYPKSTWKTLAEYLEKNGIEELEELIETTWTFQYHEPSKIGGRVQYGRHLPVEMIKVKKK